MLLKLPFYVLLFFKVFFVSGYALAYVCNYQSAHSNPDYTWTLSSSVYAGDDLPVGSVLYSFQLAPGGAWYACVGAPISGNGYTTPTTYAEVTTEPMGAPFSFAGNPLTGPVYKTNVDGIAVGIIPESQLSSNANAPTLTTQRYHPTVYTGSGGYRAVQVYLRFVFIKTGPVANGSVVNMSSLPHVSAGYDVTEGWTNLPIESMRAHPAGTLNISSSTCEALSKTVELGDYEARDYFTGKGSSTPWIDSSIELINCPSFSGYYSTYAGGAPQLSTSTIISPGIVTENSLLVSLAPSYGIIDGPSGIMAIDTSKPTSAQGVGIQLGYGSVSSSPVPWDLTTPLDHKPGNKAGSSISIPMAARYYQTEDKIFGGVADGKLVFTINYR